LTLHEGDDVPQTGSKNTASDGPHAALQALLAEEAARAGLDVIRYQWREDAEWHWIGRAPQDSDIFSRTSQSWDVGLDGSDSTTWILEIQSTEDTGTSPNSMERWLSFLHRVRVRELRLLVGWKEKRRDLFLGLVSHELKTPLTAISGVFQLQLRDDEKLTARPSELDLYLERRKHLNEVLMRQVSRLTELIDGLLNLSRIRLGKFSIDPVICDISRIFRSAVLPRLTLAATESLLVLKLEAPEDIQAEADPIRIEELFINLGMQAMRFSPEGGTVSMKLEENRKEGTWRLRVKDQGPTWPRSERERLFLPFETAQRGGRMGGAGLGLYLARQIAELHGGTVRWLEPSGKGGNQLEAEIPRSVPMHLKKALIT